MSKRSKIFYNKIVNKKELKKLTESILNRYGQKITVFLLDQLKELGFEYATKSGISISLEDLIVPPSKGVLSFKTKEEVLETEFDVHNGQITESEKFQKIINLWDNTSQDLRERVVEFFEETNPLNSVYMMAFSGARGNISQVRQLIAMRGLMVDSNGQLIDLPIQANFREGLSTTEYIISSYGARKGLVDTAIKTADSGYLTRRLVEVAQCMIISEVDCKTLRGIFLYKQLNKEEVPLSFQQRSIGRVLAKSVVDPDTQKRIAQRNEVITFSLINRLIDSNIRKVLIRSPLTCECRRSVCQYCYGWNLASRALVDLGESVGLIAAQSIGEPGTQLTMRTFHTGGVFESKRVSRAQSNFSGFLMFSPTMKKKYFRTKYGEDAFITQNDSFLMLLDYNSRLKSIKIGRNTLIFGKDNDYVRRGDVLFEPVKKKKYIEVADQETKYVKARHGGEIVPIWKGYFYPEPELSDKFKEKNGAFWVLSGQVHTIPLRSQIRARELVEINHSQSIAQSKLASWFSGFVYLMKDKFTKEVRNLKVCNSYQSSKNLQLYVERQSAEVVSCKVYISKNFDVSIAPYLSKRRQFILGLYNNRKYRTKSGGLFYATTFWEFNFPYRRRPFYSRKVQSGLTVFHIPEQLIRINKSREDLKLSKRVYVGKQQEIICSLFSGISGFINFQRRKIVREISIKPARQYLLKYKRAKVKEFDKKIYFPGEILFEQIHITELSYFEIQKTTKRGIYIYIRPVVRYEITKENPFKKFNQNYFIDIDLKFEEFTLNPLFEKGLVSKSNRSIQLAYSPLAFDYSFNNDCLEVNLEIKSLIGKKYKKQRPGKRKKKGVGKIHLGLSQTFSLDKIIPKEMANYESMVDFLVEDKQFVEAYTNLALLNVLAGFKNQIVSIKQQYLNQHRNILLITEADFESIYLEDFNHSYKENQLIKVGQDLGENLLAPESGIITEINGGQITYHRIEAYLFGEGGLVRKKLGDFIKPHEELGQLIFERLKADDIVQGLPKVEEVLEARKPKYEAVLSTRPGILRNISHMNSGITLEFMKPIKRRYQISLQQKLIVKQFDFINVCEPLTEGALNPHTFLHTYFTYLYSLKTLSMYDSAYRSLKQLQTAMLASVQEIYFGEGVVIADKHVELIIKQMTDKVYIESPGNTNFLPGDVIDLEQANYINLSLKGNKKLKFRPIVVGITKSSLKTEGFLAAASFQETMRVLTHAALRGKVDWLRGLKENVVTGKLICAGTAFYENNDLTSKKMEKNT